MASKNSWLFRPLADRIGAPILALQHAISQPKSALAFINLDAPRIVEYGGGRRERLHIFENQSGDNSVVSVFCHGGAWGSGRPWMYYLAALGASKLCNSGWCIVLEYPTYPDAAILEQAECVNKALSKIMEQDGSLKIFLFGHSSGANISALALLRVALSWPVERRKQLLGFVSLCGVYDIASHLDFETQRGVAEISPMSAAAGGGERFWECSPTTLIAERLSDLERAALAENFPRFLAVHGLQDTTVPVESTRRFVESLRSCGVRTPILVSYPPIDHVDPIYRLMRSSGETTISPCVVSSSIADFALLCLNSTSLQEPKVSWSCQDIL